MIPLDNDCPIETAIVNAIFPSMDPFDKEAVTILLWHFMSHDWIDGDSKADVIENICKEFRLIKPEGGYKGLHRPGHE